MIKNRLKVLLAERDMSQADLARALDVHKQTVSRFARQDETNKINGPMLDLVCAFFDVQPCEVLRYIRTPATEDAESTK